MPSAGRSFTAWRVVNCGITAGAVTTAAIISAQFAGIPAAVITAAILLQSRELTRYSGMFMTEPLATLMLALLAWTWVRNASAGWTIAARNCSGVAMGGLLAARTIFILTDTGPPDSARQGFVVRLEARVEDEGHLSRGRHHRHQPVVDSQHRRARRVHAAWHAGRHQPAHGLRSTALRSQGIWASNPGDGWPEIAALKLDIVTSEVMLAKHRQTLTLNWMMDNPGQVLHLMRLHVSQELKPGRDLYSRWLLPAAALLRSILWRFPGYGCWC